MQSNPTTTTTTTITTSTTTGKPQKSFTISMEKVKLMCSYGGKIHHRPHDRQLSYVGGDTKILTIDRNVNFNNLSSKLNALCDYSYEIRFKYKLPGLDLDALISVFDDDDVENMFFEYDLLRRVSAAPPRLRLFVFFNPANTPPSAAEKSINPDFLFGFDKEYSLNYAAVSPPENAGRKEVLEAPATVLNNLNVTRGSGGGGGYVFPAPFVYGAPMASGGYFQGGGGGGNREQPVVYGFIGGGNREQPVAYGYIPPVGVSEQGNIPVSGSPLSYDGAQHPTVMMGSTCNHESKVGSGAQHDA